MTRLGEIAAKALSNLNGDRYRLTLMVARRAEALANGAVPLVQTDKEVSKFADIALLEIAEGKILLESGFESD